MAAPVNAALARLAGLPASGSSAWPATCLTWDQATELADLLGARLPTSTEWEWMADSGIPLLAGHGSGCPGPLGLAMTGTWLSMVTGSGGSAPLGVFGVRTCSPRAADQLPDH